MIQDCCFHLGWNQRPVQPAALAAVTQAGTWSPKAATVSDAGEQKCEKLVLYLESLWAIRDRAC